MLLGIVYMYSIGFDIITEMGGGLNENIIQRIVEIINRQEHEQNRSYE